MTAKWSKKDKVGIAINQTSKTLLVKKETARFQLATVLNRGAE